MARSNNIIWNIVLPILVFVPMAVTAFRFLLRNIGPSLNLAQHCPTPSQGKSPFQLQYLGGYAPPLEQVLCILVAFFHPIFQRETVNHTPFVFDFLASFSACVVIPFLEASRSKRPLLLGFPVIMGIIYQLYTGAVTFSAYWAVFLVMTRDHAADSQIVQADAEAVLFGLIVGYFLPSLAMAYKGTPEPIAVWQVFPVLVSLFRKLHLLARPKHLYNTSGYRTVRATYILTFLISSIAHLCTLADYNFDPQTSMTGLIPSLEVRDGQTALTTIIRILQWDAVFIFGSTFVASLWFAGSVVQGILLITWIIISSVILGPGAAVSGIFLWREANLNKARQSLTPKLGKTQ